MFKCFYPDRYVDSTYGIDFRQLYQQGYRGLLFDIDNTLVPHGAPADARAKALFAQLREIGFSYCFISNNKQERVESFCKEVGGFCICKASKPNPKGYKKGMELLGTDVHTTLFVGDQLFTDIYGAKRAGIFCILVKPIHPKEEIQIVLKRHLEKLVLHFYLKEGDS